MRAPRTFVTAASTCCNNCPDMVRPPSGMRAGPGSGGRRPAESARKLGSWCRYTGKAPTHRSLQGNASTGAGSERFSSANIQSASIQRSAHLRESL